MKVMGSQSGDTEIRNFLQDRPAPGFSTWHDGTSPHLQRDSSITEAFYLTATDNPSELSYGDGDDNRHFTIDHEIIMDPTSERSKEVGYWAGAIAGILDEG